MIRILIADLLPAKTIDQLNEIPEFEIIERTDPPADAIAGEINAVDAVIAPATTPWPPATLENAVNLKIIILTGGGPDALESQLAGKTNITVRRVQGPSTPALGAAAKKHDRQESEVIQILKDFFNV